MHAKTFSLFRPFLLYNRIYVWYWLLFMLLLLLVLWPSTILHVCVTMLYWKNEIDDDHEDVSLLYTRCVCNCFCFFVFLSLWLLLAVIFYDENISPSNNWYYVSWPIGVNFPNAVIIDNFQLKKTDPRSIEFWWNFVFNAYIW